MNTETKIRRLVPNLQKLSLGCEVKMFDRKMIWVNIVSHGDGTHTPTYIAPNGTMHNGSYTTEQVEEIEVIGHKIELHHVLQAVETKLSEHDIITKEPYLSTFKDIIELWRLTDDQGNSLSYVDQSNECKEYVRIILN